MLSPGSTSSPTSILPPLILSPFKPLRKVELGFLASQIFNKGVENSEFWPREEFAKVATIGEFTLTRPDHPLPVI